MRTLAEQSSDSTLGTGRMIIWTLTFCSDVSSPLINADSLEGPMKVTESFWHKFQVEYYCRHLEYMCYNNNKRKRVF